MRPAVLTDGAKTGRYRVLTDLTGQRMTRMLAPGRRGFPGSRNAHAGLSQRCDQPDGVKRMDARGLVS